jgi:hypothetical protein
MHRQCNVTSLITPSSAPEAKNSASNVAASASIACHVDVKRLSLSCGFIDPVDELCGEGAMQDVSGTPACSSTQAGVPGHEPIGLIANSGADRSDPDPSLI